MKIKKSNRITFIAAIDRAMKSADTVRVLEDQFREWKVMPPDGEASHYRAFMEEIRAQSEEESSGASSLAKLEPSSFQLDVDWDGIAFARDIEITIGVTTVIEDVVPGQYTFRHRSGFLLWEKRLEPEDLIWSKARPGAPFPLAASSDNALRDETLESTPEPSGLRFRVHAGMRRGRVSIAFIEA